MHNRNLYISAFFCRNRLWILFWWDDPFVTAELILWPEPNRWKYILENSIISKRRWKDGSLWSKKLDLLRLSWWRSFWLSLQCSLRRSNRIWQSQNRQIQNRQIQKYYVAIAFVASVLWFCLVLLRFLMRPPGNFVVKKLPNRQPSCQKSAQKANPGIYI